MADKLVLVGIVPEAVILGPQDQVTWFSETSTLRIEFDPNRCPFQSNVYQAPPGMRLLSGPPRHDARPGLYKYRVAINDQVVGAGEILLREK